MPKIRMSVVRLALCGVPTALAALGAVGTSVAQVAPIDIKASPEV